MITKQCKTNIRMHTIYVALFIGVLMVASIWIAMFAMKMEKDILQVLIVSGCILLASLIIGLFLSIFKVSKFKKHLKNEHAYNIDQETFTKIDKHYSTSKDWLVYHKGVHYVPLNRKNISSIQFDGHHLGIHVMNDTYMYKFKCRNDAYQVITNWYLGVN